jgi:hypothetical protein
MRNSRFCHLRRDLLLALSSGAAVAAFGATAPTYADDVSGTWITQRNKYGELIRIDFAPNGDYRRVYELSRGDFTIETGKFEVQSNGSVRLYNIRWSNPGMRSNAEETLDRTDRSTLTMRDSQRSALHRAN